MHEQEAAIQKAAKESEERKQLLKEKLLPQPGAQVAAGAADLELEGPDQTAHTLSRAESEFPKKWNLVKQVYPCKISEILP